MSSKAGQLTAAITLGLFMAQGFGSAQEHGITEKVLAKMFPGLYISSAAEENSQQMVGINPSPYPPIPPPPDIAEETQPLQQLMVGLSQQRVDINPSPYPPIPPPPDRG